MKTTKAALMQPGKWTPTPLHVLADPELSAAAKNCFSALLSFTRGREDFSVEPTETQLASVYATTARTCRRHLAELRDRGYIAIRERSGRRSCYVFLQPEMPGQGDLFEQDPAPAGETDFPDSEQEPRSGMTAPKAPTPVKNDQASAKTPVRNDQGTPVKNDRGFIGRSEKGTEKQEEKDTATDKPPQTVETEGDKRRAAAAFLSPWFDGEDSEKLLTRYGSAKILWTARQLAARTKPAKNPAGLITHLARKNPPDTEVAAAAEEQLGRWRKENPEPGTARQQSRAFSPATPGAIWQWLDTQPDGEDLKKQARGQALISCGGNADIQTLVTATQGALWRIYRQRTRPGSQYQLKHAAQA